MNLQTTRYSLSQTGCVIVSLFVLLVVRISARDVPVSAAGCAAVDLCCQGQNISCLAAGPRHSDKTSETCFCDEICLLLGDCCLDYKHHCPAKDCVLSDRWSDWSDCDARCGSLGVQTRSRTVLVHPRNGGKVCADAIERRQCEGVNCKFARASEAIDELKETAEIVPASYATWRKDSMYSPFEDIRQNLFMEQDKYADMRKDKDKPSYCAKYKITEARQSCQRNPEARHKGAGDQGPDDMPWVRKLVRGSTVCVECQQFATHKSLGNRCYGHGVEQRQTQWKAVTIPRCHGSWVMTSRHLEPCSCDPSRDVSFVFV